MAGACGIKSIMKTSIKRGLALAAIAGASCATGLLAPAAAAAGDPPRYILESVANPGKVLTVLPYGPVSLVPLGATPGQAWELAPSDIGGVNLVNRDTGECLTVPAPAPNIPVVMASCVDRPGQDWRQRDGGDGTVRFEFFGFCLSGDYGRVSAGDCSADAARWRLIMAP